MYSCACYVPSLWPFSFFLFCGRGEWSIFVDTLLGMVFERVDVIVIAREWFVGVFYGGVLDLEMDFQWFENLTLYYVGVLWSSVCLCKWCGFVGGCVLRVEHFRGVLGGFVDCECILWMWGMVSFIGVILVIMGWGVSEIVHWCVGLRGLVVGSTCCGWLWGWWLS